jgi:hypothetical protein
MKSQASKGAQGIGYRLDATSRPLNLQNKNKLDFPSVFF